jgi:hypothetical protein
MKSKSINIVLLGTLGIVLLIYFCSTMKVQEGVCTETPYIACKNGVAYRTLTPNVKKYWGWTWAAGNYWNNVHSSVKNDKNGGRLWGCGSGWWWNGAWTRPDNAKGHPREIPEGWEIAPNTAETREMIRKYPWSTSVAVTGDGTTWWTGSHWSWLKANYNQWWSWWGNNSCKKFDKDNYACWSPSSNSWSNGGCWWASHHWQGKNKKFGCTPNECSKRGGLTRCAKASVETGTQQSGDPLRYSPNVCHGEVFIRKCDKMELPTKCLKGNKCIGTCSQCESGYKLAPDKKSCDLIIKGCTMHENKVCNKTIYRRGGDGDCAAIGAKKFEEAWKLCEEDAKDCKGLLWNPCIGDNNTYDVRGSWRLIKDTNIANCTDSQDWNVYFKDKSKKVCPPPVEEIACPPSFTGMKMKFLKLGREGTGKREIVTNWGTMWLVDKDAERIGKAPILHIWPRQPLGEDWEAQLINKTAINSWGTLFIYTDLNPDGVRIKNKIRKCFIGARNIYIGVPTFKIARCEKLEWSDGIKICLKCRNKFEPSKDKKSCTPSSIQNCVKQTGIICNECSSGYEVGGDKSYCVPIAGKAPLTKDPVGKDNAPGDKGAQGAKGMKGVRGPKGLRGPTGPAADNKTANYVGLKGPRGPLGVKGIKGAQGARGKTGIRGHTGVPGPATDNDPWSDYKVKSQLRKVHDKIIRKIKTRKAQLTVKQTDIYLQLPRKNKAKLKKTFFVDGGNKYWVQAKKRKFILSSNTDEKIIPS